MVNSRRLWFYWAAPRCDAVKLYEWRDAVRRAWTDEMNVTKKKQKSLGTFSRVATRRCQNLKSVSPLDAGPELNSLNWAVRLEGTYLQRVAGEILFLTLPDKQKEHLMAVSGDQGWQRRWPLFVNQKVTGSTPTTANMSISSCLNSFFVSRGKVLIQHQHGPLVWIDFGFFKNQQEAYNIHWVSSFWGAPHVEMKQAWSRVEVEKFTSYFWFILHWRSKVCSTHKVNFPWI